MYGNMKKAKYLGLGLTMFCLITLTAVPALAQDNGFGGSVGQSGSRAGTAGATELMEVLPGAQVVLVGFDVFGGRLFDRAFLLVGQHHRRPVCHICHIVDDAANPR